MHNDYRLRKADIVLGAALLVICLGSFFMLAKAPSGSYACVSIDGRPVGRYALSEDMVMRITGPYGHNTLEIKDGQARVTSADCPGGDCMSFSPISRSGQLILCAPHRLAISIEGPSVYDPIITVSGE